MKGTLIMILRKFPRCVKHMYGFFSKFILLIVDQIAIESYPIILKNTLSIGRQNGDTFSKFQVLQVVSDAKFSEKYELKKTSSKT